MKPDIIIKQLDNGHFDVHVEDKSTEELSFDEMLGVVAQLTVPNNKRFLQWLMNSMKISGVETLKKQSNENPISNPRN